MKLSINFRSIKIKINQKGTTMYCNVTKSVTNIALDYHFFFISIKKVYELSTNDIFIIPN